MTCHEFTRAIDPYLDDELSVMEILRMQRHMLSCEACRLVIGSEAALHGLLRRDAVGEEPPAPLRERIVARVRAEDSRSEPRPYRRPFGSLGTMLTGAGVIGLLLVASLITASQGPADLSPLAAELAAKHVLYSVGARAELEVHTADTAEMTEWMGRRMGLSGSLPRLEHANERLLGGRVSTVADAPAAYLLYEVGGRRVSLFITRSLPATGRGVSRRVGEGIEVNGAELHGVTVLWWQDEEEGRFYAAASSRSAKALQHFAALCIRSDHAGKPERSRAH